MATNFPEFKDPVNKRWAEEVERAFREQQRLITALQKQVEVLTRR